MPSRSIRRTFAALALGVVLGACQLTVGIDTTVDPSGSGVVSLHMTMDEELLTTARADVSEMRAFESLFEDLAGRGWTSTRTQPNGGLQLRAERAFTSTDEHRAAITQLQGAVSRNASDLLGELRFDLRLNTNKGLFQTRAKFKGTIDTSAGVKLDPHLLSAVEDLVRFEVGVTLPGQAAVADGDGSAEGTRIVWRPSLGEKVNFGATSEALRLGPMFLALFAALALVAGAIGSLVSRRRRFGDVAARLEDELSSVVVLDEHRRPLPDADLVLTSRPIDVEALLGGTESASARPVEPSRQRP